MTKMTMMSNTLHLVEKEMKRLGFYDEFVKNLKKSKGITLEEWYSMNDDTFRFMTEGFSFIDSKEGFDYWNKKKNAFLGF